MAGGYNNIVRNKLAFWQKHFPTCDFYGSPLLPHPSALTGESGMRGTVGLMWVKKISMVFDLYSIDQWTQTYIS